MSKQHDPNDAVDYIIKHAAQFADAKAQRVYLEEFRKSKKAMLMRDSLETALAHRSGRPMLTLNILNCS